MLFLNGEEIIKEPLDHGDVERTISLARSLTLEYGLLFKDGAYLQKDGVIAPFLKKANFDMNKLIMKNMMIRYLNYIFIVKRKNKMRLLNNLAVLI